MSMRDTQRACEHAVLWPSGYSSSIAASVGHQPFSVQQRFTAATGSRQKLSTEYETHANSFPLPLILPGDELAHDPKYPPQSFSSWLNEPARNEVTSRRKTIYVANYPVVASDAPRDHHRRTTPGDWTVPKQSVTPKASLVERPAVEDVLLYLQGFFHGLPVKILPSDQEIGSWMTSGHKCIPTRKKNSHTCVCELPEHVEVRCKQSKIATRVRVRHLHDDEQCSAYQTQLNLLDLLDHAIAILPEDAYCLLLLVENDLYEDDNDDFCCGRAFGGSRIAVVSSSQYQPALDKSHGIDLAKGHNWPGSHCAKFVGDACGHKSRKHPSASRRIVVPAESTDSAKWSEARGMSSADPIMIDDTSTLCESSFELETPIQAAVAMHYRLRPLPSSAVKIQSSSYLRRVGLTASHELLHCFGLDHCVYYACSMQGTSSMIEDSRQPPYLCPVCENKLARATSNVSSRKVQPKSLPDRNWWNTNEIRDWKRSRKEAILAFCRTKGGDDLAFAPLAAWLEAQIKLEGI